MLYFTFLPPTIIMIREFNLKKKTILSAPIFFTLKPLTSDLDLSFSVDSVSSHFLQRYELFWGFPGGSVVKNLPANAEALGDTGLIPGWGRSPGEGNGKSLQYSCLGNPMDRRDWWAALNGITESWT